ncbi:MAG TPA: hypothetical protein VIE43_22900 [Thermoanaerobaculia bacterium]|nr:hypothetical protein [Thermoanaerobaculia bacterium]
MTRPPSVISPPSAGAGGGRAGGMAVVENAETIARLYRRLVLLVGFQILLTVARIPLLMLVGASPILGLMGVAVGVVVVGSSLILCITAYQLAGQMGLGSPLAWALVMFLPCINVLSLLVLSSKAQAWCRQNDIKVGLLGPTRESIEELRRRVMTAPFD